MKRSSDPLRVCVDARLPSGVAGGVEQAIIGLASGLSKLDDGDEEYLFLAYPDAAEWIRPYVGGPCHMLWNSTRSAPTWKKLVRSALPPVVLPPVVGAWRRVRRAAGGRAISLPKSDGTIEKAGTDVMHFMTQNGFLTDVPSIYQPHDLQHLHLPEFFNQRERLEREAVYRTFCEQARMVAAMSSWGRRDLIQHYALAEDKVRIVPWAPVLTAYPIPSDDDLASLRQKFSLPEAFVYYPAQTWAHKNHVGLLEALAILRDRHELTVPLVCSGRLNEFFPKIERRVRELRLAGQVSFLGFVSPLELQCLYKLCRGMVFPTKFEGGGMPVLEAFLAEVPVACSNVTLLPEQVGDAALIFDPYRPEEIAANVLSLWTEERLRDALVKRGKKRVERFTWDRTARIFRAHYRRIANRTLTEEDRALLVAEPLV